MRAFDTLCHPANAPSSTQTTTARKKTGGGAASYREDTNEAAVMTTNAKVECICGLYMSKKKRPKFDTFVARANELGVLIVDMDLDSEPMRLVDMAAGALGEHVVKEGVTYAILHKVTIPSFPQQNPLWASFNFSLGLTPVE